MRGEITIIGGTGQQGVGLALRWAKAGKHILIGSRDRSKAESAVEKIRQALGPGISIEALQNREAVLRSGIIVLTVPYAAQATVLQELRESFKAGDLLIDVTVPLYLASGDKGSKIFTRSAALQAAELAPQGVTVVSAFHNVGAKALQNTDRKIDCDVIVCGNSREGKEIASRLIQLIPGAGFVDGGPLENSVFVEALTSLLISINKQYKVGNSGIRITGI